jgi:hypothetical protein
MVMTIVMINPMLGKRGVKVVRCTGFGRKPFVAAQNPFQMARLRVHARRVRQERIRTNLAVILVKYASLENTFPMMPPILCCTIMPVIVCYVKLGNI